MVIFNTFSFYFCHGLKVIYAPLLELFEFDYIFAFKVSFILSYVSMLLITILLFHLKELPLVFSVRHV